MSFEQRARKTEESRLCMLTDVNKTNRFDLADSYPLSSPPRNVVIVSERGARIYVSQIFVLDENRHFRARSRWQRFSNGTPFFAPAFVGMEIKNPSKKSIARLKFHSKPKIGAISLPLTKNSKVWNCWRTNGAADSIYR